MNELPSPGVKNAVTFFNSLIKQDDYNKKIKNQNINKQCNNFIINENFNVNNHNNNNAVSNIKRNIANRNCDNFKQTNNILLNNKKRTLAKELNEKISGNKLNSIINDKYLITSKTNKITKDNNNTSVYCLSESKPTIRARREYALTPTINVNFQSDLNLRSLRCKR